MTQNNTAAARGTLTHRSGASRKLLARKAAGLPPAASGEALEDVFPAAGAVRPEHTADADNCAEPATADVSPAAATLPTLAPEPTTAPAGPPSEPIGPEEHGAPPPAPTWSSEDEAALNGLLARRKAAGYQRRGRDVGGQLVRVGDIAPNPGTVVANVVALVAERGTITRGELLDVMAAAPFAQAKARPQDRAWSTGYVAGAIRDGFLAIADAAEAAR